MKIETLRQSINDRPAHIGGERPWVPNDAPDRDRSLKDMLRVLRRQASFAAIVFVLLTLPFVIYSLRLEPQFKSSAAVVVELRPQVTLLANGSQAAREADPAYMETLASVIRSRKFVQQAMTEMELFDDPEFAPSNPSVPERLKNFVSSLMPLRGAGDADAAVDGSVAPASNDEAMLVSMANFDDRLEVVPQNQSHVIKISFSSEDRIKSAMIANHLAAKFVSESMAEKSGAVTHAIVGISERLDAALISLAAAERQVAEMRLESNFLPGQESPMLSIQSEELTRSLMRAKAEYAFLSAKLQSIEAQSDTDTDLASLAEISSSAVIGQLRLQLLDYQTRLAEAVAVYGDEHPRVVAIRAEMDAVQARIDEEVGRIVVGIRSNASIIAAQISDLEAQLAGAQERNVVDGIKATALESAESDVALKRSLYESLLRQHEEISIQQSWLLPDVLLISEASPPLEPSSVSATTLISGAAAVALILALVLAFLREQMDGSLRTKRQAESELRLPCFGLVPRDDAVQRGGSTWEAMPAGSALFRSVSGIWVRLRSAKRSSKVILVASAVPGEGTTLLSEGLAACASRLDGLSTALVDFRGGSPRHGFRSGQEENEADCPAEAATVPYSLEDIVQTDAAKGIDVFSVGGHDGSPVEFASEMELTALIARLRNRYDVVFIDSPPVLGFGEAGRIAHLADATLLAVRWGSTDTDAVRSAMHTLMQSSAQVLGTVLTHVDLRRQHLYGQGENIKHKHAYLTRYST